jgi:Na+-driven multidrug efflux pump
LRLEPHQHPLVVKKVGVQYWSLNGAQGKYNSPTWVYFVSSWGFVMPLAALLVFSLRLDLQGLTAASLRRLSLHR